MLLLRDEMVDAEACMRNLVKSFLQHLHFRVELFGQVTEDFLFAECVAVDVELHVWVSPSLAKNQFAQLVVGHGLARVLLSVSAKRIVHVQKVNLDWLLWSPLDGSQFFQHA